MELLTKIFYAKIHISIDFEPRKISWIIWIGKCFAIQSSIHAKDFFSTVPAKWMKFNLVWLNILFKFINVLSFDFHGSVIILDIRIDAIQIHQLIHFFLLLLDINLHLSRASSSNPLTWNVNFLLQCISLILFIN